MTDLQKEAEAFLELKGISGQQNKTISEWIVEFSTQSKHVQAEKLKAQIEVLRKSSYVPYKELIEEIKQQLNQL
jgi:hypothetical protein